MSRPEMRAARGIRTDSLRRTGRDVERALQPVARRPLPSQFVSVFLIAWGGVVLILGPARITGETSPRIPGSISPSSGRYRSNQRLPGCADSDHRREKESLGPVETTASPEVNPRWYAVALLPMPSLLLGILGSVSLVSPSFIRAVARPTPGPASDVRSRLRLFAGIFEEFGGRGSSYHGHDTGLRSS